jgi:ATP-dependent RNA helicase SUPV3L1/SUV3
LLPDVAFSLAPDAAEAVAADAAQDEPVAGIDAIGLPEETTSAEAAAASESVPGEPASAEPVVAAETATPDTVEVWRPGGRSDERRPRHDRNRHRKPEPRQDAAQPAAAQGEGVTVEGAEKRERHGHGRRERHKNFRRPDAPADGTPVKADGAPEREPREGKGGRPPRERFQGKGRDRDQDKGRFQGARKGGRDGRQDGGPSLRPYASSAPRERERPLDPNSPFAKLAALKEQLANRKD